MLNSLKRETENFTLPATPLPQDGTVLSPWPVVSPKGETESL